MVMSQKVFLKERIEFGESDKLVELVEKTALKEDVGKELGMGV